MNIPGAPTALSSQMIHVEQSTEMAELSSCADLVSAPLQPITDVRSYLESRLLHASYQDEHALFVTLPESLREDVAALEDAVTRVQNHVKTGLSVNKGCGLVLSAYRHRWNAKTFRALYDRWADAKDWTVLVNRSKAPVAWRDDTKGLPTTFIDFCASRFGSFRRDDGKRQALASIKRQWRTGLNDRGDLQAIPGYEKCWDIRNPELYPVGWSYSNILRQIKSRAAFTRAVQALMHQGTAAAKEFVPKVRSTRAGLLFMSEIQFDDVKTDFRIIDPVTGQIMDLWLLVARDRATALLMGFGMRPARAREDGTQEHLKLRDMKQLCGWLLERFGLPPYEVKFKVERGTATLSEGSCASLQEMLPGRIKVALSSMIGGNSSAGYFERRIGNSRGKASLESHNRLMHTMASNLPGQTGPVYGKRPADLQAREKEATQIWELAQHLPEHLRGAAKYPVLTIAQARAELMRIFDLQNQRTEHELEGFEEIVEWFDGTSWRSQREFSDDGPHASEWRKRKESPLERTMRLAAPHASGWSGVSPLIIKAFYEHTVRPVPVKDNGEIEFHHEGKLLSFRSPQGTPLAGCLPIKPRMRLLAYFHPDDPRFLHLTDGNGAIVGTWVRSTLAADDQTLSEAIQYSTRILNVAKTRAEKLDAPERQRLDAMRAHNAELLGSNDFVEICNPRSSGGNDALINSPIASGLDSIRAASNEIKTSRKQRAREVQSARDLLMKSVL